MRFAHLSDLHLGKRVCEFSMLEDQKYILEQILALLDAHPVDGVLLAGDLYDKPVPPAEAVRLLDWFLTQLAARKLPVFAISGNHDSADRVAFGSALLADSRVYVSPVFTGAPQPIPLQDAHGTVDVYLLPFLKPAMVRHVWPDEPIESYNDALACVLRHCTPDPGHRSVLVAHQFVAGAAACESEEPSVGGVDSVDAALFDAFDYVALGHLHSPQKVGRETLRYCGTPLKYSFSEAGQCKSATFVELGAKGEVHITTAPLTPRHELRGLRGSYTELTDRRCYEGTAVDDYLYITLTDEQDVPDALARLRVIYPNLMQLDYDNQRTRQQQEISAPERTESISPLEHLAAFYQLQNNQPLTAEQTAFCQELIEEIWKEFPSYTQYQVRSALAKCGLTTKHIESQVRVLSGGEQAKVRLCKLVNRDTNVLLLDEPTNHLDVDAKEALKSALKEYRGSILLICHEPEFYQDVVNEVWDMSKWTT